ncbi:MAG: DUF2282 domain-containing protein [Alphaproteobacteria bacterium]|nr:DUF2282 domain-containing protein [Alphaproteobacteria bacterium]MBT5389979.1 DUF2282 domain-containing protein [Alphaproteobacteria bacterium]MBT5541069.1 DUF2282 domain-containing protein [Alphaproteobacteria bacterium]
MSSKKTTILTSAVAGALALTLASGNDAAAKDSKSKMEKCYGIAIAFQGDCGSKEAGHSCAGQNKDAGDPNDFLMVIEGNCERIVGGSLTPGKEKS